MTFPESAHLKPIQIDAFLGEFRDNPHAQTLLRTFPNPTNPKASPLTRPDYLIGYIKNPLSDADKRTLIIHHFPDLISLRAFLNSPSTPMFYLPDLTFNATHNGLEVSRRKTSGFLGDPEVDWLADLEFTIRGKGAYQPPEVDTPLKIPRRGLFSAAIGAYVGLVSATAGARYALISAAEKKVKKS